MYICICNAVTEREIKACASAGARTLADLRANLGVATNCGRCAKAARVLLRDSRCDDGARGCVELTTAS